MLYCLKHEKANEVSYTAYKPARLGVYKALLVNFVVDHAEIEIIGIQAEAAQANFAIQTLSRV
mgnify:CR=1 FL=1